MDKLPQFGEQVEGYDIPVLNEREIPVLPPGSLVTKIAPSSP